MIEPFMDLKKFHQLPVAVLVADCDWCGHCSGGRGDTQVGSTNTSILQILMLVFKWH